MASALRAVGAGLLGLLATLLGIASLGLVLLLVGLVTADGNALKPYLAHQLSAAIGREVVLAGDLQVDPGLEPRVVIHGFKLADAPWADRPYMVEIPRLAVRFDLPRVLGGEIALLDVTLEAPAVTLERSADGRANWQFKRGTEGDPGSALPVIESLRMDGGVLTYIERARGVRSQIEFAGARGALTGPQRTLQFQASGEINEAAPLHLRARAEALAPTGDGPWPLQAELQVGQARVTVDGRVAGRDGAPGRIELDLHAQTPETARLQPLLPWELPDWPGLSVEAQLVRAGTRLAAEDLSIRLGESDLSGRIALDTGGPRPHVSAALEARTLDLVQLLGRPSQQPGPLIPETPLPFAQLRTFDAELRLDARTLYVPQLSLEHVGIGLVLDDGMVRVDPLELALGDGRVRGQRVRVDARSQPPRVAIDLALERIGLNALLQEYDVRANAFGRLGGGIELRGQGDSLAAILGTAAGSVEFVMRGGQVDALLASLAGQDITRILNALGLEEGARTPLRCFIADFAAADGVLDARTLILDTPDVLVVGAGDVDLDAQRVNLALLPQHKDASLFAAQAPVHIAGPLEEIELAVDTGAAVASLLTPIELPDADDPNCDALAEAARRS